MGTVYTNSDIEIHLTSQTNGMDTTGYDEIASNKRFAQLLRERIEQAYPDCTVYVHMEPRTVGGGLDIESRPASVVFDDEIEVFDESILALNEALWNDLDAWMVEEAIAC